MVDSRTIREPIDAAGILADVDLECVFHARNVAEAERHRAILEGHGILTRLGGELAEAGPTVDVLAGLPLFVPVAELERASEILAGFDIEAAEWDEEEELEDEEEEEEDDDYFAEDDEDEFEEEEDDDDDEVEELEDDE